MEVTALPPVAVAPANTLVWSPHPILAQKDRREYRAEFFPGESIAEYLERQGIRFGAQPVELRLEGARVPRHMWKHVRPRHGQMITIRAVVHGGGGGSNPVKTILTIALMVYAPQLATSMYTAMGGSFVMANAGMVISGMSMAISMGGSLLLNAMFPAQKANISAASKTASSNTSATYAITGGSNRARAYEPMLLVLGTHRVVADYGAKTYTEYSGADQYLYQVFHFGLSDVQLSDFKIGDTPIENYSNVEIQVSGSDGKLDLFPGNVDSITGGAITKADGALVRTSSIDAVALAVDITGSLYKIGDSGELEKYNCTIQIEYRAVGDDDWTPFVMGTETAYYSHYWSAGHYETYSDEFGEHTKWIQVTYGSMRDGDHTTGEFHSNVPGEWWAVPLKNTWRWRPFSEVSSVLGSDPHPNPAYQIQVPQVTISNGSSSPVRKSYKISVPKGQYEVRITRISADSSSDRRVTNLNWSVLRTYQPDEADYSGQTRVAVKIKASGQLNGQIEELSALATARIPVLRNGSWVTEASSNPAFNFLWFARGKRIGGRRHYGACLAESRINLEAIVDWAAWCDAKGLSFNAVLDSTISCAEALNRIARMGRGSASWATGRLGAIWDAGGQPYMATFGMANIKRNSFSVEYATEKLADEIVVTFINQENDWQQEQVRALVPGVTDPQSSATLELFGCTDKGLAGREACLQAASHLYLRRRITWETDIEGLVVDRGDVVLLSHDLTQWGVSGRAVGGDGNTLILDRAVDFGTAATHWVGITFPNGYFDVLRVQTGEGETDTLTLLDPWPEEDDQGMPLYAPGLDPDHPPCDYKWVFDVKETPGKRVKIVGVQPLRDKLVRIVAQDEDDRYYQAEFGSYQYLGAEQAASRAPLLQQLEVTEELLRVGSGFGVQLTLTWDVVGPYDHAMVRIGVNGDDPVDVGRPYGRRFTWQAPDSGELQIEVTAISAQGSWSEGSRIVRSHTIIGKAAPPANVGSFFISGRTLSWTAVPDVDLAGYRIRWASGADLNWETAQALHEGLLTASPFSPTVMPAGTVTLMVKAVDTSGNESREPAYIITDLGDPAISNVVETVDFHESGWAGEIVGGEVEAGTGDLVADPVDSAWPADGRLPAWPADGDTPAWPEESYAELQWLSPWITWPDMPADTLLILQSQSSAGIKLEYRLDATGPAWPADTTLPAWPEDGDASAWPAPGEWQSFPGSGMAVPEVSIQLRLTLPGGTVRGRVSLLQLIADAPDLRAEVNDVALAAGGSRIPVPAGWRAVKGVHATLQSDGGGAMSVRILDKSDVSLGALVAAYDKNEISVGAVADIQLSGY